MNPRVRHPQQSGSRISRFDSLFEQVERVQAIRPAPLEAIPVPEVIELHAPVLTESVEQGRAAS